MFQITHTIPDQGLLLFRPAVLLPAMLLRTGARGVNGGRSQSSRSSATALGTLSFDPDTFFMTKEVFGVFF
jgi:hypothetical protein